MFTNHQRWRLGASSWLLLSSSTLLLWLIVVVVLPNSSFAVAAADSSSSSSSSVAASEETATTLQHLVRSGRPSQRQRRAQQQQDITPEIVGGEPVAHSNYPFFVYATTANATTGTAGDFCGGTLIHPDVVLTTATCATLFAKGRRAYIGGDYFSLEIDATIPHAAYNPATLVNNIMLVKLKGSSAVPPIGLNRHRWWSWKGRALEVLGKGTPYASGNSTYTADLRLTTLKIQPRSQCVAQFPKFNGMRSELCAGVRLGGKGACTGDAGGPLFKGRVQHGIATYASVPCAANVVSTVFIRVSYYYQWIWYYACENTAVRTGQCK